MTPIPPIHSEDSPRGQRRKSAQRGSVLILVLWMSIGLVSIALYFADAMSLELRASDNRTSGLAAEQAIEGAARYVSWALTTLSTNGVMTTNSLFRCENIAIGSARAWVIGRQPLVNRSSPPSQPVFGLVDEASKLNLNRSNTNVLLCLPSMLGDLAEGILDWRSTNSALMLNYESLGYSSKHGPFESVDELRLIRGMTLADLDGDDLNRNGVQDSVEKTLAAGRTYSPGLLEYVTVYSREPNFHADGTTLTNINSRTELQGLLEEAFGSSRATQLLNQLGFRGGSTPNLRSPLQFYLNSGLSSDDFEKIAGELGVTTNSFSYGRVNINSAPEPVLTALFMGAGVNEQTALSASETLIEYRQRNLTAIGSIAWFVTALGLSHPVVTALASRDWLTTRSFQYSADIATVGPFGRGYRRVRFVFDLSDGTPKIIHRQDLSRLGWALGDTVRESLLVGTSP